MRTHFVHPKTASRLNGVRKRYKWWQLVLFAIGVISAVSIVSALFFAVGDKPAVIVTDVPPPPVDSAEFAEALGGLVDAPIERGGTIAILHDGDQFFPDLLETIRGAKHSINFSVYVWKDGKVNDEVLAALLERQQHGVQVRLLLDGFGALPANDKDFERLIDAGGKVKKFRMPKFGKLTRFHRRNHRRSIVVDGVVGYTGGMAVGDQWLGHAQDADHWRDLMFKVTGPLARSLQAGFVDTWVASTGEILVGPHIYPPGPESAAGVERFIHLANSPADDDQSMAYFFLLPILSARQSIHVVTPYFIPDKHLLKALGDKAKAGVEVTLVLPGEHTDNWITRASAQSRYKELFGAGIKVFEYQPAFIHSKYMIIDGKWSIVGSPNLNFRSRQLDEENAFGILDPEFAARLEATFQKDLKHTVRINPATWGGRNPMSRLFETLSRVLDEQS